MSTNNSIHNKNGQVSAYGLACGYANTYAVKGGKVELYHEGGVYHVRMVLEGTILGQAWNTVGKRWATFERLVDARKCFVEYCVLVNDLRGKVRGFPWLTAYADNPK